MNIWVIGRSYPTKQNKMRGSFEVEQAQMLAARGHKVTYLASVLHPFNKVRKWGFDHFQEDGIDVYTECIPFAPERMHLHPKRLLLYMWRKLLAQAEKEQGFPDIIHIHYPGMNSYPEAVLAYQKRGCKVVVTDHWSKTLQNAMDAFQRKQLIEYANKADAVLCVSAPLREALYKVTGTKKEIQVVPNIVSSIFKSAEGRAEDGEYRFVAVGRLAPVKHMDLLTDAFIKTFRDQKNVRLTIVGGGGERAKIEKIVEENHAGDQVHLTGTLSREDTAKRVAEADALVSFSSLETFGVPVIEAWACGKPVVVTETFNFLDHWDEALGFMVPCGDVAALQHAMRQVIERKDRYDPEYISDFAVNHFGEEAVYEKLMRVYTGA